jgi:plasmid stabilization system protein ParE
VTYCFCLPWRDSQTSSQTLRILSSVDPSIVEQYFSQRLQGLHRSAESYEDEVLALLEVVKILAAEDAELYARSIRDALSPAGATPSGQRSFQVLERAVENVLSSLRDGAFIIPFHALGSPDVDVNAVQVIPLSVKMSRQRC